LTFNGLHDLLSQKIIFFLTTVLRISNPEFIWFWSSDVVVKTVMNLRVLAGEK
jgi:hypothetical protein